MDKDDRRGAGRDRLFEHFPRVDNARIQAADGRLADLDHLRARIQQHGHKIFLLFTGELAFHQRGNIEGIFYHRFVIR